MTTPRQTRAVERPRCRYWNAAAVAALVAAASPAGAVGPGTIGVYSDTGAGNCNVVDAEGLVTVAVVLVNSDGATFTSFALEESDGLQMSYINESSPFQLTLGDTRSGITVTFGACLTGSVHLLTVRYNGTGTTSTCEAIGVVPHPGRPAGLIEVFDCTQTLYTASHGGTALVSDDGACGCDTPVADSSWGRVKSLYR
jgi:hypothetical protein